MKEIGVVGAAVDIYNQNWLFTILNEKTLSLNFAISTLSSQYLTLFCITTNAYLFHTVKKNNQQQTQKKHR
jgi:hypothetical protein